MKEMGGIGRWALILLLLGNVYGGFAQDANTARAQHIYELFVAGQGDSIHAALNRELQEKLAPALFNDSFRQAEKMFGKSISKGEWKTDSAQGITIYYSDVEFERYNLRFLVAFDAIIRMSDAIIKIQIKCEFEFNLKLSSLLRRNFLLSSTQLRRLFEQGVISLLSGKEPQKYKVKDGDILLIDKEHLLVMMDFVDSFMVKTGID